MFYTYADKSTPYTLSPESLDWHLARGWYRMGSTIFTTHFLFFNDRPYSALWIRIDLKDHSFSKRQRKLLRKNADLFSTQVTTRRIDDEREDLYERYAENFDGRLSPTIRDSLEDYDESTVFNTHETTVRDRISGKLVACSYFDVGDDSAASILGIYDPLLSSFSLGYYTMLLEMQHCMDQGLRYYYPGYVVPGYHRFDYKLRLGKAEYYDIRREEWLAYDSFDPALESPVEAQLLALRELTDELSKIGHARSLYMYPLFEAGLYDIWNDDYYPYPYLVPVNELASEVIIIAAFDPKEGSYYILECRHMVQTQLLFNAEYLRSFRRDGYVTELLAVRRLLFKTYSASVAAGACDRVLAAL